MIGAHGKRRLAERVARKGYQKGWQEGLAGRVGERLAKGWRRVGRGFACTLRGRINGDLIRVI